MNPSYLKSPVATAVSQTAAWSPEAMTVSSVASESKAAVGLNGALWSLCTIAFKLTVLSAVSTSKTVADQRYPQHSSQFQDEYCGEVWSYGPKNCSLHNLVFDTIVASKPTLVS